MRCTSKKKGFDTEAEASEWIRTWNLSHEQPKHLGYCYICTICNRWHTTTNPPKINQVQKLRKQIKEQNKEISETIVYLSATRKELLKEKNVINNKLSHLDAILKINKMILEQLKTI